jgi:hypothetical protein
MLTAAGHNQIPDPAQSGKSLFPCRPFLPEPDDFQQTTRHQGGFGIVT